MQEKGGVHRRVKGEIKPSVTQSRVKGGPEDGSLCLLFAIGIPERTWTLLGSCAQGAQWPFH